MITREFKIGEPANQLLFGIAVIKELTRAGVPVLGELWPQGCEYGTLTVTSDSLEGKLIYSWDEA